MWGRKRARLYFHMSYNQSPNKSVINDIMNKLTNIIKVKHMPFAFLVGDLPVYVLVTLLKAENSVKYHNILPFLGPFHTQSLWMVTVPLLGILVLLFQHIFLHYAWRQQKK